LARAARAAAADALCRLRQAGAGRFFIGAKLVKKKMTRKQTDDPYRALQESTVAVASLVAVNQRGIVTRNQRAIVTHTGG
jgi:hypothetical protein